MSQENYEERIAALERKIKTMQDFIENNFSIQNSFLSGLKQISSITEAIQAKNSEAFIELISLMVSVSDDQIPILKYLVQTAIVPDEFKQKFKDAIARRESKSEHVELLINQAKAAVSALQKPPEDLSPE